MVPKPKQSVVQYDVIQGIFKLWIDLTLSIEFKLISYRTMDWNRMSLLFLNNILIAFIVQ